MSSPLVINVFAGPGAGKSTTAALVFGLLKSAGVNAELVTNVNYLLRRVKDYNPKGRMQTMEQAVELDVNIESILDWYNIEYTTLEGNVSTACAIAADAYKTVTGRDISFKIGVNLQGG